MITRLISTYSKQILKVTSDYKVSSLFRCAYLSTNTVSQIKTSMRKFIIDSDVGRDDAQAILMALNDPNIDVIAIMSAHGNINAPQAAKNILRVLKTVGRLDIPVYQGCNTTILGETILSDPQYHGVDGLGDVPDSDPPDYSLIQTEPAPQALVRLAKEHSGEITLVPLGPLTNVATALKIDPDFGSHLKECFIMGGNYYGRGNVTMCAEWNFYCDPEAASIVLSQIKCPTTLVGWEACIDFMFPWSWNEELKTGRYRVLEFIANVVNVDETCGPNDPKVNIEIADQFAMAAALNPDAILESKEVYAKVELKGELTRGMMVVDWNHKCLKPNNLTIVIKPNKEVVKTMLENALMK